MKEFVLLVSAAACMSLTHMVGYADGARGYLSKWRYAVMEAWAVIWTILCYEEFGALLRGLFFGE